MQCRHPPPSISLRWWSSNQGNDQHGSLRSATFVSFTHIFVVPHPTLLCDMAFTAILGALSFLAVPSLSVTAVLSLPVSLYIVLSQVSLSFAFIARPGLLAGSLQQRLRVVVILFLKYDPLCNQSSHIIVENTLCAHYCIICYLLLGMQSPYTSTLLLDI